MAARSELYPSPRQAASAPPEQIAYVAAFDPHRAKPDEISVVDVDPKSSPYSKIIGKVAASAVGDEFHHFGWNICSYLPLSRMRRTRMSSTAISVVPRLRSSRIYVIDTKPHSAPPKIVKVIKPSELADKTGYTRPHTVHCGPERHLCRARQPRGKRTRRRFRDGSRKFEAARAMGHRPHQVRLQGGDCSSDSYCYP